MDDNYPSENAINHETTMSPELNKAMQLAELAGEILKKYHGTSFDVDYKRDEFDPVTIADRESDDLLRMGIGKEYPNDEILSEENPLQPSSYEGRVWMVDPLDDTKGFVAGRDTPGVMIGLLENRKPIMGVVYLPFRNEWYYGEADKGAFRVKDGVTQQLRVRHTTDISEAVLAGRNVLQRNVSPLDKAVSQLGFKNAFPEACFGAEIGLVAAGEADVAMQTSTRAGKWDTLAAQVILTEAGGVICDIDGNALDYAKPDSHWDRYVLAAATPELLHEMLSKLSNFNEEYPPDSAEEYETNEEEVTTQEIINLHSALKEIGVDFEEIDIEHLKTMPVDEVIGHLFDALLDAGIEDPEAYLKEKGLLE
jgi:3'(2'),5'-bisphosphate nucleotidase